MLWVAIALMTGAAVLAVLWPLGLRRGSVDAVAADRAFYDSELASIARDEELGLITAADAESARTEAARRLLASPQATLAPTTSRTGAKLAAVVALIALPALAVGLYTSLGSPDYPDQPLSARLKAPAAETDVEIALAKISQHLAENPDDLRGWQIIAPVYMKLGKAREGANAFRNMIRLQGPEPGLLATYGEALVVAANGQITAEAREIFERALAGAPGLPQAKFYLGLGAEQAGDTAAAAKAYTEIITADPDAPFVPMLRERLAAIGAEAPPESAPKLAAPPAAAAGDIASLPANERDAAIRSMVERLSTRLDTEGGTVDAWSQLIRAYSVLREPDKARAALDKARSALAGNEAALTSLASLARELGLGG